MLQAVDKVLCLSFVCLCVCLCVHVSMCVSLSMQAVEKVPLDIRLGLVEDNPMPLEAYMQRPARETHVG